MYDALKVKALLNQIAGKTHNGAAARTPALFGMNFQSVYIGQSVAEPNGTSGGYQNAAALPGAELLKEVKFVDASIGEIVSALKRAGHFGNTLTAKEWRVAHRSHKVRGRRHKHLALVRRRMMFRCCG